MIQSIQNYLPKKQVGKQKKLRKQCFLNQDEKTKEWGTTHRSVLFKTQ